MDNNFFEVKISDLGRVLTGNTPPTSNRKLYGGKYPLIMPTDIVEGSKYIGNTIETLSDKGFEKYKNSLIPSNTPCVVTIGTIGKKICLSKEPSFTNQAINAVIVNLEEHDPVFIFYVLKYNLPQVKNLSSGTASGRENVSKSSFSGIKVKVTDLPTQKKIANILSAYDDLIENNNQRIQLLEEMAAEIYKEWFVRFRFPGYESATFVDKEGTEVPHGTDGALPLGWTRGKLRDIVDNIKDKVNADEKLWASNLKYIPIDVISRKSMYLKKTDDILNAQSSLIRLKKYDIIFGAMRAYFHKVIVSPFDGVTRATCFVLRPKCQYLFSYSYLTLFQESTVGYAAANSKGSTIPYAFWNKGLDKFPIVIPDESSLRAFNKVIKSKIDFIIEMHKKNETLQQTRDLLLPRLISGKLSVENLELSTIEAASTVSN